MSLTPIEMEAARVRAGGKCQNCGVRHGARRPAG